jgi:hypothetical protein
MTPKSKEDINLMMGKILGGVKTSLTMYPMKINETFDKVCEIFKSQRKDIFIIYEGDDGYDTVNTYFQDLIDEGFLKIYLDNIFIHSENEQEHTTHVSRVLQRLADLQLPVRPEKCFFHVSEIEFLGFIISNFKSSNVGQSKIYQFFVKLE